MSDIKKKHLILIKNHKAYLVFLDNFDKKSRKYTVYEFGKDKVINAAAREVISIDFNFHILKDHADTIEYDFSKLWSKLIQNHNIISFNEFIINAIEFYSIKSLNNLNNFLRLFNEDFIFYKIFDNDKVYLNSKEVVDKIIKNINQKNSREELNESFLIDISKGEDINWSQYSTQIDELVNYLTGGKNYSRKFIDSILNTIKENNFDNILNYFKKIGVFSKNFHPLYESLGLKNIFPYEESEISDLVRECLFDSNDNVIDAFTIDDFGTNDYDDALTIIKEDDIYFLYVHFTDFSYLITHDSPYSDYAKRLMNTIYKPDGNFNLFSSKLINQLSLCAGDIRPVLSLKLKLNGFDIIKYEIESNLIKVSANYTYEEFQSKINGNTDFEFVNRFTQFLNTKRLESADFKFFNQEVSLKLDKSDKLILTNLEPIDSRRIISELMIMANFKFSKFFINNSLPGIFRSQKKSENLETSIIDDKRPFCFHRKISPVETSSTPDCHYGLGLESYMQITSPIRRYLDTINMWQASSFINGRKLPFDKNDIDKNLSILLPQLSTTRVKSKKIYKYWILRYIDQTGIFALKGYIYSSLKDKYIIFFNDLNIFESISKEKCRNIYAKDDFIEVVFDSIDYQNLELVNTRD